MRGDEPFGTWLRRQVYRNDPTGDLARDFKASGSRAYTAAGVRRNMGKLGACHEAVAAWERAVEEWSA